MLKQFSEDLNSGVRSFGAYIQRIRYALITLVIYTFLLHFRLLTSVVPGVDTESIICNSQDLYLSWHGIGRYGLILSKYLLNDYVHNPDFAVITALLLIVLSCLLVFFLAETALNKRGGFPGESLFVLLFGMTVISHPILTEQLYFTLQCNSIALAFLLLALSLFAAHLFSLEKNPLWLAVAVLLQLIPYSSYQAMVPLFITGAVAVTFLQNSSTNTPVKKQLFYVFRLIAVFLGGFGINQLLQGLFASGSSYLSEQIFWGKQSIFACLSDIVRHMGAACLGKGIFYFGSFGISCIMLLIITIRYCIRCRDRQKSIWTLLLLLALYLAPFYMTILQGSRPVYRSQLVLPFISGLFLFLLFEMRTHGKKAVTMLLVCLCIVSVYREASDTSRLYYGNAIREQADVALAGALRQDIAEFTEDYQYNGTVVFLGKSEAAQNPSCVTGDVMGQSIFDWDTYAEPHYYFSTLRIVNFMNCLGCSYTAPDAEQVLQATAMADSMPCYPAAGSITWMGNVVVVKLSEE